MSDNKRKLNRNRSICLLVKEESTGRCAEIITALTPLPSSVVTKGRNDHPCPKCDGKSVLWPDDRDGGVNDHGRLACRNCTNNKPTSDIIDTVRVFGEYPNQIKSAKAIAQFVGLSIGNASQDVAAGDIVDAVCRSKRMPSNAFRQFGARPAKRKSANVARVDVYNEQGAIHSYFDLTRNGKGWFKKRNSGEPTTSGMFFPGRLPKPGEHWLIVEGVKDAAALGWSRIQRLRIAFVQNESKVRTVVSWRRRYDRPRPR